MSRREQAPEGAPSISMVVVRRREQAPEGAPSISMVVGEQEGAGSQEEVGK